ncbi:hypothetical protein [Pseudomonas cannabina]|uniref:hypothetical protein n=1 Tax=Pseudomonas cannabina TaxID=86840 RepID=UPI000EFF3B75|nr:hypothetical protein [Pseudomonas cannabina]
MPTYSDNAFEKVSHLLSLRSEELGATAYSLNDEVVPLAVAMDPVGPMTWALILHADAMARLTGYSVAGLNALPFTCVENPEAPYGNQGIIQPGSIPLSIGLSFLDTALEHAIALGIKDLGYSLDEWRDLPADHQVIPIEPFFQDLKTNWINETLESGELANQIIAWPRLALVDHLQSPNPAQGAQLDGPSSVISFPSMR